MARRWTFREIQAADRDWPTWIVPGVVVLALLGGLFQWSGHNPWVALVGIGVIIAVALPIRRRQLRRRLEELGRRIKLR